MLHVGDEPVQGFRLEKFLGRGNFGEVWRAHAPGGTHVALKFITLSGKQGMRELKAIQKMKMIRHPNLLNLMAFWLLDRQGRPMPDDAIQQAGSFPNSASMLIVAMPLGDKNLLERLHECQKKGMAGIPVQELLNYMEDAAKALDYLNTPRHDLGEGLVSLQHCDVKPQNIMIVGDSATVCDFGLARVLEDFNTTTMGGSPAYISPECLMNQKPSHFTDQYSLAISYIELRTGRLPFGEIDSLMQIVQAHTTGKLDLSGLSPAEQTVISKATAVVPEQRYASMMELVRSLRSAVEAPQPAPAFINEPVASVARPAAAVPMDAEIIEPTVPAHVARDTDHNQQAHDTHVVAPAPPRPVLAEAKSSGSRVPKWRTTNENSGSKVAAAFVLLLLLVSLVGGTWWMWKASEPSNSNIVAQKKTPQPSTMPQPNQVASKADHKPGEVVENLLGMKLAYIPAGQFVMGSPLEESSRNEQEREHAVQLTRPFWLSIYEITQGHYQKVMGQNPSYFSSEGRGQEKVRMLKTGQFPVDSVTWAEAVEFCRKLSEFPEERKAGRSYRLPTEAEWEYACRAGTHTAFHTGHAMSSSLGNIDVSTTASPSDLAARRTCQVGSFAPNAWGVYDMHGNVYEWCSDWYDSSYYYQAPPLNPTGPATGVSRILRGGAWYLPAPYGRSADRFHNPPDSRDFAIGFRVVCELQNNGT